MNKLTLIFSITIILLSGCGLSEKTWKNEVISIESRDGRAIRITETITRAAWPVGTYQAQLELQFYDGIRWQELDRSYKRTPVYSKLYTEDDRFIQLSDPLVYYQNLETKETLDRMGIREAKERRFPIGGTYKTGYVWDIFVSPDQIGPEDYQFVSSTIQRDLDRINESISRPRAPKDQGEDIGCHPEITSIVYRTYDYEPWVGIQHHVDVHFSSDESDLFISQAPPNSVILVLPETKDTAMPQTRVLFKTASIGFITDDQEHILIREPSFNPEIKDLVGDDWLDFYKSCTNSEGQNIFYYYKAVPWQRNEETK